ncbi:MAG TPA: class I SAM-dependent methyltransferase [Thermodesulfobacteriota bacterium]|nr:class I SAM-dependent methyltransferase [Deltaproteobacteria bacterium]HQO77496.1 class I SAM-dependent methyltransferase [Thermodesulfobacteriota bacterium]
MEVNTTYEPFSREPEYIEANREFLKTLDLRAVKILLDLACGTGTITELLLEQYPEVRTVVGLDLSRESLLLAKEDLVANGKLAGPDGDEPFNEEPRTTLLLTEGTADVLPLLPVFFDAVLMGNSIHLLTDVDQLLEEVHRVLKPGGPFAFNSSFYAGTMTPGTEKFYHQWIGHAAAYIKYKDEELRKQGKEGIKRKRGTARQAFSNRWLSKQEWNEALTRHGFKLVSMYERTVMMNQRCFETIGAYAGLASVLFSGYPVEISSEALQVMAGPALKAVNMESVPRLYLEVSAQKA